MYLTHYNLRIKPSPDPRFFWLSEKHKEALASLKYGIQENKGFLLLTGDIGTGKTTLLNCLLDEIDPDAVVASIPDPDLSIVDFFKLLSKSFHISLNFDTKADFIIQFENFLHNTYSEEKKALLIIDEAQKLNQQLLEQIRLLSNIEKKNAKLINIFLVGQNELYELIRDEQNKALRQRITVHYQIEPLTELETRHYIKHRLSVAGSEEEIFASETFHEIYSFSKGYPRLINTVCDRMLLSGYVSGKNKIDAKTAKKCADELTLPGEREDARTANQEDLNVNVDEQTPFTWDSDSVAEPQEIEAEENAINSLQKKPGSALPIALVVFAIFIVTVLSLYKWLAH